MVNFSGRNDDTLERHVDVGLISGVSHVTQEHDVDIDLGHWIGLRVIGVDQITIRVKLRVRYNV